MISIKNVIEKNYSGPNPVSFVIQFDENVPENIIDAFAKRSQSPSEIMTVFEQVTQGSKILYSTTFLREDLVVRNVVDIIDDLMRDYQMKISYYFSQPVWPLWIK